jgi:2-dehydropantoate 2-reductase
MDATNVVVIGPGAIGCTFAAALIEAGHSVVFAGRTPFDRIVVAHPGGQVADHATFVKSAADLRPAGIVLLATKAYQTPAARDLIRASCGPGTILAVLQNGIDHESRVRPYLDLAPTTEVLPVMVACPADRTAPGQVTVGGRAVLEVKSSAAGRRFAESFTGSFAVVKPVDDMHTSLWRKLLMNAVCGGIGVLTHRGNELFATDANALVLARALAIEALAVARADGANLDENAVDMLMAFAQRGSTHLPSIVVDRRNGQETEWKVRNQIIVDKGIEHSVSTPLNQMLSTLIRLGEPTTSQR